ncbi:cupin domain-containing protein [Paenibacillus campi]|uniref:cupin domain-containing protein n=1 Tax=Paenibacillus campi TaxID=3106031 RepID=UPI002AFEEBA4|nr:cupin domain-containing protein [Paenibacillus sp. SGZ-1014]
MMKPSPSCSIHTYSFTDDGKIPNHSILPVILYSGALAETPDTMEALFNYNGWRNSWTNGVFDYHHYHSNAHEVLGVISGTVTLQLGGEHGDIVTLHTGDIIVLPAGTGHCRLEASANFRIVGAYPQGMSYNVRTGKPGEHEQALKEIPHVPVPATDPVFGEYGPLLEHWAGHSIRHPH